MEGKIGDIRCLNCEADISKNSFFYTVAKNSYMFGLFCCQDCAANSEYHKLLKAYVLKINSPPASHKELVIKPDPRVIKQFKEESEKRELRKKYFS